MNQVVRWSAGVLAGTPKIFQLNWIIVIAVCFTACIGFVLLYSVANASYEPWASKQMVRFGTSFALMVVVALIPIWFWRGLAFPIYLGTLALLVLVEFRGATGMGATRWINLGFVQFQPSELMKVSMILVLASYYDRLDLSAVSKPHWMIIPIALILVPAFLVMRQPDLGTAVLIIAGGGILMFLGGVSLYYFAAVGATAAGAIFVIFLSKQSSWPLLSDYQFRRIETFLNPNIDPLGASYHITQSKIALGSGWLEGRGFLNGTQNRLRFLPERHTDFVFTTLAEEFGLIGGLILLGIYGAIIGACFFEARKLKDRFCTLLILGLASTLFLYFAANLAMVTGLIPVVGVPLPLISYGGSAMLILMFSFGLIQSALIHGER